MSKEIETLKTALGECRRLQAADPQFQPLRSIEAQLQYLIGIAERSITDRSRLNEIILGVYAAREFETRDMDFANRLYEVEEIVDWMREGRL